MLQVRVTQAVRITNQHETACNYDVVEILPGVYPMERNYAGIMVAYVPGLIVENFERNSLMGHSSNHTNNKVGQESGVYVGFDAKTDRYASTHRHDGAVIIEQIDQAK